MLYLLVFTREAIIASLVSQAYFLSDGFERRWECEAAGRGCKRMARVTPSNVDYYMKLLSFRGSLTDYHLIILFFLTPQVTSDLIKRGAIVLFSFITKRRRYLYFEQLFLSSRQF